MNLERRIRQLQGRQLHALINMDIEASWEIMRENGATTRPDNEVMIVSMHKARVELTMVPPELRLESVEWLRAHNYSRRGGTPLPPPGVLPY